VFERTAGLFGDGSFTVSDGSNGGDTVMSLGGDTVMSLGGDTIMSLAGGDILSLVASGVAAGARGGSSSILIE